MHRQALATLAATRPALARLHRGRDGESLRADIREAWAGVETALRALVGGTPLGGQALIREARTRQLLTFEQANALASFSALNDRASGPAYMPSDGDINEAREAFQNFEGVLSSAQAASDAPAGGEAMSTKGLRLSPLGTPRPVPLPREGQPWGFLVLLVVLLGGAGGGGWWFYVRRSASPLSPGIVAYQAGKRELATSEFERALREDPRSARAHVYLARMQRESGNLIAAREHLTLAIQVEPANGLALREMGSTLLAAKDYELARRFYIRALEVTPEDHPAQGYLGCALMRLGRNDEGSRWLERAGPGGWSDCNKLPTGRKP